MKNLDVVMCGEAMGMFIATAPGSLEQAIHFSKRVTGAELNVAIGLARLGVNVGWISRVGQDSFGQAILDTLEREGIDASCVRVDRGQQTGLMLKSRSIDGMSTVIEYYRRGSAASRLSLVDYVGAYVLGARHLHLTGIAPAISMSSRELTYHLAREMRAAGKTISFDPKLRPELWPSTGEMIANMTALASQADWVFPKLADGYLLTGFNTAEDIASFYLDKGVRGVAVKLNSIETYFAMQAGSRGTTGVAPVEHVVDSVGAGDGFAVGMISALLEGKPVEQAVSRGNRVSALALQALGDSEGYPPRSVLDRLESTD